VELADVDRLLAMADGHVAALRDAIRNAGLDERFLAKIARVGERLDDPLRGPMRAWHARRMPDVAAIAARLFMLHDPVSAPEAARALGDRTPLAACGLLHESAGVTSRAHLAVAGDHLVFGDRAALGDAVPPLNAVTVLLARAAIPRGSLDAALDLGCGAGAIALALTGSARRVVATDLNPRALAWARFNARLNDVASIDFRRGDLFEPVRTERFDLIVSQPPFVARRAGVDPSTFAHGGERGDELALQLVAGAVPRLSPGGRAVVLADWPLFDGDSLESRVRTVLGDARADALVLQCPTKNLDEYCTSVAAAEHPRLDDAFGRAACAQRDHFERIGLRGVAQGLVVVQASGRGLTTHVPVRHGHDAPVASSTIDRIVASHALASASDGVLLDARLRMPAGTRLVEQPSAHGAAAAVIVQLPPGWPEWPYAAPPAVALDLELIDEAPTVLEAARAAALRDGTAIDAAVVRIAAVARDALRRGALEAPAGARGEGDHSPPFE
jgi:SAM-dependent methyltransferase